KQAELVDDPSNWSLNDVKTIRKIMADFLPHIRFFNISSEDFSEKVLPYVELLPRELLSHIVNYYLLRDYKPNIPMLPPRKGQVPDVDSVIINKQQAAWVLCKIMESTGQLQENQRVSDKQNVTYNLNLLYRQSKDGVGVTNFQQRCLNKGPTIVIGKVLGTEEILGGYNPI